MSLLSFERVQWWVFLHNSTPHSHAPPWARPPFSPRRTLPASTQPPPASRSEAPSGQAIPEEPSSPIQSGNRAPTELRRPGRRTFRELDFRETNSTEGP